MSKITAPLTSDYIQKMSDAGNKALGSTYDFLTEHMDDNFQYDVSDELLCVDPTLGLYLSVEMAAPPCVSISLPEGTTLGHLIATLMAFPLPGLMLLSVRGLENGTDDLLAWSEKCRPKCDMFVDALERFDSRGLQSLIIDTIDEFNAGSFDEASQDLLDAPDFAAPDEGGPS